MILVTGGAGFIGSNFVLDWLQETDEPVINLDLLTYAGNLENLASLHDDERHHFVRGDIDDPTLVHRLLEPLSDLRFHKWAYPVGATLFVLHIAVGQAEAVKYATKRSGPQSICEWNRQYLPLLPLPWCPARP